MVLPMVDGSSGGREGGGGKVRYIAGWLSGCLGDMGVKEARGSGV